MQTKDADKGIELPLLKMKAEDGIDFDVIKGLFLIDKPLFSIHNLVTERNELVSNMVFTIERRGDSLEYNNAANSDVSYILFDRCSAHF